MKKRRKFKVLITLFLFCIINFIVLKSNFFNKKNTSSNEIKSIHKIFFIGNSYTGANDLPSILSSLALSGGHKIEKQMLSNGGWTLSQYSTNKDAINKLNAEKWDYVVLQEQSQVPSVEPSRSKFMYPAVRLLVQNIRSLGAVPILFLTWGHRDGFVERGLIDYESMQNQLSKGYLDIAKELNVIVAPVGEAWRKELKQPEHWDLWQPDNSHPSMAGSYLAACVFYAVIFKTTPYDLPYTAGLPKDIALHLQKLAGDVVLNNRSQWNLQ